MKSLCFHVNLEHGSWEMCNKWQLTGCILRQQDRDRAAWALSLHPSLTMQQCLLPKVTAVGVVYPSQCCRGGSQSGVPSPAGLWPSGPCPERLWEPVQRHLDEASKHTSHTLVTHVWCQPCCVCRRIPMASERLVCSTKISSSQWAGS